MSTQVKLLKVINILLSIPRPFVDPFTSTWLSRNSQLWCSVLFLESIARIRILFARVPWIKFYVKGLPVQVFPGQVLKGSHAIIIILIINSAHGIAFYISVFKDSCLSYGTYLLEKLLEFLRSYHRREVSNKKNSTSISCGTICNPLEGTAFRYDTFPWFLILSVPVTLCSLQFPPIIFPLFFLREQNPTCSFEGIFSRCRKCPLRTSIVAVLESLFLNPFLKFLDPNLLLSLPLLDFSFLLQLSLFLATAG